MDAAQAEMHTSMPGRVVAYDREEQTADVEPQLILDGRELPVIPRVRVAWPRGGDGYIVFPLGVGDFGLLIFCEADISAWVGSGQKARPGDEARHGIHGAVFCPGIYPSGYQLEAPEGVTVLAGGDTRVGAADATEPVLQGQKVQTAFSNWVIAFKVYTGALQTAVGLDPSVTNAINTASDVLVSDIAAALSAIVKVK
jgi:hypothetical protein